MLDSSKKFGFWVSIPIHLIIFYFLCIFCEDPKFDLLDFLLIRRVHFSYGLLIQDMINEDEADKAIAAMHGTKVMGWKMKVEKAKFPK